jgi:hypothetical protein
MKPPAAILLLCAWILWGQVWERDNLRTDFKRFRFVLLTAHATIAECREQEEFSQARDVRIGINSEGIAYTHYKCFPDTFDPRGAK